MLGMPLATRAENSPMYDRQKSGTYQNFLEKGVGADAVQEDGRLGKVGLFQQVFRPLAGLEPFGIVLQQNPAGFWPKPRQHRIVFGHAIYWCSCPEIQKLSM